jgi:hypothetical protein
MGDKNEAYFTEEGRGVEVIWASDHAIPIENLIKDQVVYDPQKKVLSLQINGGGYHHFVIAPKMLLSILTESIEREGLEYYAPSITKETPISRYNFIKQELVLEALQESGKANTDREVFITDEDVAWFKVESAKRGEIIESRRLS